MEPRLTPTPLVQPTGYCGHFRLARTKRQSVISYLKNTLNSATQAKLLWLVGDWINTVPLYLFIRRFWKAYLRQRPISGGEIVTGILWYIV